MNVSSDDYFHLRLPFHHLHLDTVRLVHFEGVQLLVFPFRLLHIMDLCYMC